MYSIFIPFLCKFSAKNWFIFEWMCTILCLFEITFLFCRLHSSTNYFAQINICYIFFFRVWGDAMTSWYLESAADIHVCLQYWVFCSIELWLPFYCLWSLHLSAWGISHFLTLFFSACVLLFSESLKCACKGFVCWLHWVPFTAVSRVACTVLLHELPFSKAQLRNK